jgi:hypothetical protein
MAKTASTLASTLASTADTKAPTSEFIPLQLQSQPRPGILIVTLHEGIGLSAPDQYRQVFNNLQYESYEINSLWQRHKSKVASSFRPPFYRRLLPYALLNFDKSQVTVDSFSGTTESPVWAGDEASCKFDVSRAAELTVHFYVKNPNSFRGSQDIFLGIARINPLLDDKKPLGTEWFNIKMVPEKFVSVLNTLKTGHRKRALWTFWEILEGMVLETRDAFLKSGRRIRSGSTLSRRFEDPMLFPNPKWQTLSSPGSIALLSYRLSLLSNYPGFCTSFCLS